MVAPAHPIADGVPATLTFRGRKCRQLFDVPAPDDLVMISWFEGGNVFRSCCTWTRRAKGKIVYFRPGHETFPTYHQPEVQRVIANATRIGRHRRRIIRLI